MSYQALLFCLDERLARVVVQVFSDLDFTVELVNEPFAAVKKLMAQRYDAVVVDCDNEPNATLLFKSARNSNSNQSSLALALVEGQTGVAKAYRIGANLVLTKPINVEQAKGTLRVARGLLRKNSDAASASPAAPVKATSAPAAPAFRAAIQNVPPIEKIEPAPAQSSHEQPAFESAQPTMAASAEIEERPIPAPIPEAKSKIFVENDPPLRNVLPASLFDAMPPSAPSASKSPIPSASAGAASAPAPAKESVAPAETKPAIATPVERAEINLPLAPPGSSPSFAALDSEDSADSGGSKKIMMIAAIVIVAAVLGYFGWTAVNKSGTPSHSSAPPVPESATSSTPSAPATAVSTPASEPTSSKSPAASLSSKPSASVHTPSIESVEPEAEVTTRKVAPAIVVKSAAPEKKSEPQSEESAPPVPNPLAVATPSEKSLSGIVSAVPTAMPTATASTLKISQGVSQGLLIKKVTPRYPQNALSMRIQGAVNLEATINKEGIIKNLKVVSGDPTLGRAAAEAVKQWRYKPYYLNGEPVEIETQITVNFKLPN